MPTLPLKKYVSSDIALDDFSGDERRVHAVRCGNLPLLAGRHPSLPLMVDGVIRQYSTTEDASGNGHTGELHGTTFPALVVSPFTGFDDCLDFDGVDRDAASSGVNCGVTGLGVAAAPFTLECWFNADAAGLGRIQVLAAKYGTASSAANYFLALNAANKVYCGIKCSPDFPTVTGTTTITAGVNHHVAMTLSGTTLTLWLDGASEGTATLTTAIQAPDTVTPLWVGRIEDATSEAAAPFPFDGRIDEVRLSDSARYSAGFTPAGPFTDDANTVGLWHFDALETRDIYIVGQCTTPKVGTSEPADGLVLSRKIGFDDGKDVYAIGCCDVNCVEACLPVDTPSKFSFTVDGVPALGDFFCSGEIIQCEDLNITSTLYFIVNDIEACVWHGLPPVCSHSGIDLWQLRYVHSTGLWDLQLVGFGGLLFSPVGDFDCEGSTLFTYTSGGYGGCTWTLATVTVTPI